MSEPGSRGSAYAAALRRLARRDHTEAEIRKALGRSFPEADVEETVGRLRRERLLDDAGFAARFARTRMAHQGHGRYRIRQALRTKGVTGAPAEQGLQEALSEVSEVAALEAVARRYWRNRPGEDPRIRMRRVWAALVRRGFPAGLVSERITVLWPRWKDEVVGLEAPEADETVAEG